jgi:SAM-dependent methyltransferase
MAGWIGMVESGFQIGGGGPRAYDHSVAEFAGPFADVAVSAVHPKPGESLLDLACGTGFVTRRAAYSVGGSGSVVGLDINPAMLEVAADEGPDIADWVCASADDMPFADCSFDAVVCQQGVQFFPDPVAALAETRRVLRPAGRLCATVWAAPTFSPYFHAVATGLIAAIGDAGITPLYAAMPEGGDELLRGWAEAAGLSNVAVRQVEVVINLPPIREFLPSQLLATPWGALVQAAGPHAWDVATHRAFDELKPHVRWDGSAGLPFRSWLLTAIRD